MSLTAITGTTSASLPETVKSDGPQRVPLPEMCMPTSYNDRVAVEAYLSVMNPAPPASMTIEA
jgi:hypothetical protein